MKTILKYYVPCIAISMGVFFGCSNLESNQKEKVSTSAAASSDAIADTLAGALPEFSERKFIRTAEMKFKSKDVASTTEVIEDIASRYNGFVTQINLTSSTIYTNTTQITADTLLEQTEYVVENTMTIRIPNIHLDSLLRRISQLADFVDYRIVSANDISLQLVENTLKIKRANGAEKRYTQAIDTKGKKLNESIHAEENLLHMQQEADNRTISNMAYIDQVNYSTVKLNFYQRPAVKSEKLYTYPATKVYEPGFLARLSEAFATGWIVFEEVLLFTVKIWVLLLLGIVVIWAYKRFGARALGKS